MGTLLSDNLAVTLLINAVATVAALGVLIWAIGPISGAHFNPVVTGVAVVRREMRASEGLLYIVVQILGAMGGAMLANLMFEFPAIDPSTRIRTGPAIWLGEIVATAGLLLVIGALTRTGRGHLGAILVPAWIGATVVALLTEFLYPRHGQVPEPLDLADPVHRPADEPVTDIRQEGRSA